MTKPSVTNITVSFRNQVLSVSGKVLCSKHIQHYVYIATASNCIHWAKITFRNNSREAL